MIFIISRMYNLVCQYGQVEKIFFTKDEYVARIGMKSSREANQLLKNLFNQEIFGQIIFGSLSHITEEDVHPNLFDMEDGSPSLKEFHIGGKILSDQMVPPSRVSIQSIAKTC